MFIFDDYPVSKPYLNNNQIAVLISAVGVSDQANDESERTTARGRETFSNGRGVTFCEKPMAVYVGG